MSAVDRWHHSAPCVAVVYWTALLAYSGSVVAVAGGNGHTTDVDEVQRNPPTTNISRAKSGTVSYDTEAWQRVSASGNAPILQPYIRETNILRAETTQNGQITERTLFSIDYENSTRFNVTSMYPNSTISHTAPENLMAASTSAMGSTARHLANSQTTTPSEFTSFRLRAENCSKDKFVELAGTVGDVIVSLGTDSTPAIVCQWQISVPQDRYMFVKVESLMDSCRTASFQLVTSFTLPLHAHVIERLNCEMLKFRPPVFIPISNVVYFKIAAPRPDARNAVSLRVSFTATTEHLAKKLHVVKTSPTWGYVTPPGYDGRSGYAGLMDARYTVEVPENHAVMISFQQFYLTEEVSDLQGNNMCEDYVAILTSRGSSTESQIRTNVCGNTHPVPEVYNQSITLLFQTNSTGYRSGFKMRFSLHRWPDVPRKLTFGYFDCSGSDYDSFKEHLHCNMYRECQGSEDEGGHCPFSSPACNGSVAVGNKCYTFIDFVIGNMDWAFTEEQCDLRGGSLAMVKTPEEWEAFSAFFSNARENWLPQYVGLVSHNQSMPHYYKKTSRWIDNTVNYVWHVAPLVEKLLYGPKACGSFFAEAFMAVPLVSDYCPARKTKQYVCEFETNSTENRDAKNKSIVLQRHLNVKQAAMTSLVPCPSGHVTHEFFSCHRQSWCGSDESRIPCSFSSSMIASADEGPTSIRLVSPLVSFQCVTNKEHVPFVLVCDFTNDCTDGADEDFCVHVQHCSGFTCRNGQCVNLHLVCDAYSDCHDGTDETDCSDVWLEFFPVQNKVPSPAIINFNGSGLVTQVAMSESEPCPDTHFRCPGKLNYCMPVYVLCNGVYDCIGHEDEAGCDSGVTCPGFYRCWDTAVCVHPDHICDGWPQCPRHDDELLCNLTCPHQCHCQGLAFLCREPFPARDFPDLRYLDASGSGMKLGDLAENTYLISALLKFCRLTSVSEVPLLNLRTLDLSENLLRVITMDVFLVMRNLKVLRLAGNPLVTLIGGNSSAPSVDVESIDISRTQLETFDSAAFEMFNTVKQLNISFSRLRTISDNRFRSLAQLIRLDLRGNVLNNYPQNLCQGLRGLRFIFTDNFRLCCKSHLPEDFDEYFCFSPQDEISSCEDLFRSNVYRLSLWMVSVMSVVGNVGSLIFRCAVQKTASKSGFNISVTNLCLADLLMGVYLAMVGVADLLYRGQYLWYEKAWTSSQACRIAGVLSLLSSEVSVFIICLITLDRFIVLRFPFSTFRFRRASAVTASCLVWLAGLWSFLSPFSVCITLFADHALCVLCV